MQQYRQKDTNACHLCALRRRDKHRAEGNAIDDCVNTRPHEQTNGTQRLLRQVGMIVAMRVMMLIRRDQFAVRRSAREIVLMKMNPAQ